MNLKISSPFLPTVTENNYSNMGVLDTRNKVRKAPAMNMITNIDVTKTKAWPELEQMGFIKVRCHCDPQTICYGAILKLRINKKDQAIKIHPVRKMKYIAGKNRSVLQLMWIVCSTMQDPFHVIYSEMVLSSKLLMQARKELSNVQRVVKNTK